MPDTRQTGFNAMRHLVLGLIAICACSATLLCRAEEPAARLAFNAQLGPRPFFLVDDMSDGALKSELQRCAAERIQYGRKDWSIAHRGAPLQFPEHTRQSYMAAARMGAGIVECDVTFTKDKELVCRHAQNDLATTTDILVSPLASRCTRPFVPASFDAKGDLVKPATAECRTSDITLEEFRSLRGKMDAFNPSASTPLQFIAGTANWRTDLYAGPTSGTLLTLKEAIELFKSLGVKMTTELKRANVAMPFNGFTQEAYAQKMVDDLKAAGVDADRVWLQSFDKADILYWIKSEPAFARQAIYLDDAETVGNLPGPAELAGYKAAGINIVGPPIFALLTLDHSGAIVPSAYAKSTKAAGLDIIAWSLERSGILADGKNGFFYQSIDSAIKREGDMMTVVDVLARQVGIIGLFSDWPATTTFYANCAGLR